MPKVHIVSPGQTLPSIAHFYGFRAWQTVAQHGKNRELLATRSSPDDLREGDELSIPDPSIGEAELPVGPDNVLVVTAPANLMVVRLYTEFRRLPEDATPESIQRGKKEATILGWKRGGRVPPLPVQRATVEIMPVSSGLDPLFHHRRGTTDRDGRVWLESLPDGTWQLFVTPHPDELSDGPAEPNATLNHGLDWTSSSGSEDEPEDDSDVPVTKKRSISRVEKLKWSPWDIEYRPVDVELDVVEGKISDVRIITSPAEDRPSHAMAFWVDVVTDTKDAKRTRKSKLSVDQVIELDLKPDFMRRLLDPDEPAHKPYIKPSSVRPYTVDRRFIVQPGQTTEDDDGTRVRLFMVHHTAGDLASGAITHLTAMKRKKRSGEVVNNLTGIHFLNDRDGHVVRMADDRYFTQHGGGKGKILPAWDDRGDINHQAIGVENVEEKLGFTEAQTRSLKSLIRKAMEIYSIPKQNVIGHGDVYIGKAMVCPGPRAPWAELEEDDLALRPAPIGSLPEIMVNTLRKTMFGGYFAGETGDKRTLQLNDREQRESDGTYSVLRKGRPIATGLTKGPISCLHEYLHTVGYVPNRNGKKVMSYETFAGSDAMSVFRNQTGATLLLFKGRYASHLSGSRRSRGVNQELAEVIYGCFVSVLQA